MLHFVSTRAIPPALPQIVAEIHAPQWDHAVGSVPTFVDGRLFLWGAITENGNREFALFEVDPSWKLFERLRLPNVSGNVAASRLIAIDGGFGFAWSSVDNFGRASIVNGSYERGVDVTIAATGRGVDFTTRRSAGGMVVGWTGEARFAGGAGVRGVHSLADKLRWKREGVSLLGAVADVIVVGRDGQFHHAGLLGLDAHSGVDLWNTDAARQGELVRGGAGANDRMFYLVEQGTRGVQDCLRGIDPATGRDRWRLDFNLRVSSIRVSDAVVAVVLRGPRSRPHSRIVDAEDGRQISFLPRESPSVFELLAVDHTHVLFHDQNTLLCERHSGEQVWRLELPHEFLYASALRFACADGFIALRHDAKLWIYA